MIEINYFSVLNIFILFSGIFPFMVIFSFHSIINYFYIVFKICFTRTPYFIACMYRVFSNELSPLLATIPAYFGKSCLIWPAFTFIFCNNDIFSRIRLLTHKKYQRSSTKSKVNVFFQKIKF